MVVAAIVTATALVIGASSFEATVPESKVLAGTAYFHFIGSPGQEDDVTKWEQITALQYTGLYGSCNQLNDGCRLKTDSTQVIASELRPKQVDVVISEGHSNPIPSEASGVTEVGNMNP